MSRERRLADSCMAADSMTADSTHDASTADAGNTDACRAGDSTSDASMVVSCTPDNCGDNCFLMKTGTNKTNVYPSIQTSLRSAQIIRLYLHVQTRNSCEMELFVTMY